MCQNLLLKYCFWSQCAHCTCLIVRQSKLLNLRCRDTEVADSGLLTHRAPAPTAIQSYPTCLWLVSFLFSLMMMIMELSVNTYYMPGITKMLKQGSFMNPPNKGLGNKWLESKRLSQGHTGTEGTWTKMQAKGSPFHCSSPSSDRVSRKAPAIRPHWTSLKPTLSEQPWG